MVDLGWVLLAAVAIGIPSIFIVWPQKVFKFYDQWREKTQYGPGEKPVLYPSSVESARKIGIGLLVGEALLVIAVFLNR